MFDRIGRAAERAAQGVSRRAFLGRLGRVAAVAAGVVGGRLTTAAAHAGQKSNLCCVAYCGTTYGPSSCSKGPCKKNMGGTQCGYVTVNCSDYLPTFCPQ